MAALTRIYTVRQNSTPDAPARLVRASHPTHALRHVADGAYTVEVASQEELVALVKAGQPVEDLRADQSNPLPEA